MLERRLLSAIASVTFIIGVLGAGPAGAQALLDFTIDPTEGAPGTTVSGQVDPSDIAASCVTDVAAFQARFTELFNGPFVGSGTEGELPQRFFPDPNNIVYENTDQLSYVLTLLVVFGIVQDINGAAAAALPQTFVMAFIDPATQDPIGEIGSFDPVTGQGSVVVPNIAAGPSVIAAACVGPVFDLDLLEAGIREGGAFLTSIGVQFGPDGPFSEEFIAFMRTFLNDNTSEPFDLLIAFVTAIGPDLLQPIVTPDAVGLQPFTVLGTPAERLNDAIADIEALVASGELGKGPAQGLLQLLRNALRSLDRGNTNAVCGQLAGFVDQVNDKVADGVLSPTVGADLIEEVTSIRAQVGCEPIASPSGAFLD
jgi:hypothetical protein